MKNETSQIYSSPTVSPLIPQILALGPDELKNATQTLFLEARRTRGLAQVHGAEVVERNQSLRTAVSPLGQLIPGWSSKVLPSKVESGACIERLSDPIFEALKLFERVAGENGIDFDRDKILCRNMEAKATKIAVLNLACGPPAILCGL
jgi:hypothetical protein